MRISCRIHGIRASRQAGTTLILVLVLVLLASLMTLFALNVGLFGQRTSANDVRARVIQQTAESGLAQGIEYFRANFNTALDPTDTTQWTLCSATDTSFPCGAVPQCANGATASGGGCTSTTLQRRGLMYKYTKTAGYDINGNGSTSDAMDNAALPLDRLVNNTGALASTTVGNSFAVNYGVGALMCVVAQPATIGAATQCTTSTSNASNVKLVTLVSVARMTGESTGTTLTTTTGVYSKINNLANAPPLLASGSIDLTGGMQIVASPNAGGTGVPISVWTRLAVSKTGTPNTCYLNDFLSDPKQTPSNLGTNPQIATCDNCDCQASLSYQNSGNSQQEGIDILNIEHNPPNVYATDANATPVAGTSSCTDSTQATCRANFDIKPSEFPCDMFQYIFGTQAWLDQTAPSGAAYAGCPPAYASGNADGTGDCFCETAEPMVSYSWSGGPTQMRVDDNWLYTNANYVIPRNASGDPTTYSTQTKIIACSDIKPTTQGIIWDQTGVCMDNVSGDIGSPDTPVLLVEDQQPGTVGVHVQSHPRMFGLLFVRVGSAIPISTTGQKLDPSTGGLLGGPTYAFQMEGGTIYGAAVVQGAVKKGNGGATLVAEPLILAKLLKEQPLSNYANAPGGWSDRLSY